MIFFIKMGVVFQAYYQNDVLFNYLSKEGRSSVSYDLPPIDDFHCNWDFHFFFNKGDK
jgi:hypothetical protein